MLRFLDRLRTREQRTRHFVARLRAGKPAAAERLLRLGVDPARVLPATLEWGSAAMVRALIARGVALNVPAPTAVRTGAPHALALANASKVEREEKLRELVAAGADPNAISGPRRMTLLNDAIFAGDDAFALFLLAHGADPGRRDRNGLTPVLLARMTDQASLERRLLEAAALAPEVLEERPAPADVERVFVLGHSLLSELHELVKWSIRNAGLGLERLVARPGRLLYRVRAAAVDGWVELVLLEDESISLLLWDAERARVLASLLPGEDALTSARLRGFLVTLLKELAAGRGSSRAGPAPETATPFPSGVTAELAEAFRGLGVGAGSSAAEVHAAYRRLAKRYHPDLAPEATRDEAERRMKALNRAYAALKKP